MGRRMRILLVRTTADASRSNLRVVATPTPRLWAHPERIVEGRLRVQSGCFVWNSEVGRRSLGIQSFWFQAICRNHIVWDATEIVEFTRKHTANVHEGLGEIRRIIESLVAMRDARRDSFVRVLSKAMETTLGTDAASVAKELAGHGIPANLARDAIEIARQQGRFTIFALVDALTRLTQKQTYVGDRTRSGRESRFLVGVSYLKSNFNLTKPESDCLCW